jgi:hypothetical protein
METVSEYETTYKFARHHNQEHNFSLLRSGNLKFSSIKYLAITLQEFMGWDLTPVSIEMATFWETGQYPWLWRQYEPLKRRSTSARLHGVVSQKRIILDFLEAIIILVQTASTDVKKRS